MTDLITAEEAQELLDIVSTKGDMAPRIKSLARTVIALHAQLADAKAAQAMVLERAAKLAWSQQAGIDDVDRPWLEWVTDSSRSIAHEVASEIRHAILTLADADGLAMVQELRADVTGWEDNANAVLSRLIHAEADRDRLAAEKAELEARVERVQSKRFRATVKHNGAEVGDLPWLEEFWAVRLDDVRAIALSTPMPSDTDGPIWHERLGWDGNKEGEG